jgi:lipooligosaccharide transport system permease protein
LTDIGATRLPGGWDLSVRAFRCWFTLYRRYWRSSVWSSVFGPLFYLGAMGYGLGSLVDRNGTAALGGVPYVVFVAPAVLVTQAMTTGMNNAAFPVFGAVHWSGIYIAARATVLRPGDIYRGHLLFIALRVALNSACFVIIMAAFGLIRSAWAAGLLPAAVLLGVAFAAPVAAWSVTLTTPTPMNYLFRFGSVPLMLFSGTFFPVGSLPGWLRPVAYATPLWHGVALCRGLCLGDADAGSAAIHVGYLSAMAGLGLWWGSRTYKRRLYV